LELHGFEVEPVDCGTRALEVLQADPPPDAVLTDLFLPDVDGRDVGAAASRLVPRPFIALVTGWTQSEQAEELNVSYFDEVFLKPVNINHLVRTLRDRLQGGKS
jgi:CheY-like chemotaxis protein